MICLEIPLGLRDSLSWLVLGRAVGREDKGGFRLRESTGLIPGLTLKVPRLLSSRRKGGAESGNGVTR